MKSLIDMTYLWLCKDRRKKRMGSDFKAEYPHAGNKVHWAKISSLLKRAQALDDTGKLQNGFPDKNIEGFPKFSFEEECVGIYKHTSEYAHGESGSMQTLVETKGNVGTIIIGSSDINVVVANGLVANYLLVFSYIFAHINNLIVPIGIPQRRLVRLNVQVIRRNETFKRFLSCPFPSWLAPRNSGKCAITLYHARLLFELQLQQASPSLMPSRGPQTAN